MRTLMVGECSPERLYALVDPDATFESDFEAVVIRGLHCLYPDYHCIVFTGSFTHDGRTSQPDLALIARDFSHWFVIEVELTSHSLEGHVLPQVRALRYGDPQEDCLTILQREIQITRSRAETLLWRIPRTVAVIANRRDVVWEHALSAIPVQYVTIAVYRTSGGEEALEVQGGLEAIDMSLGFGTYVAIDRSLQFPATVSLPEGLIQIGDPRGGMSSWIVRKDRKAAWITKETGVPAIENGKLVQLLRTRDGRISMRVSGL